MRAYPKGNPIGSFPDYPKYLVVYEGKYCKGAAEGKFVGDVLYTLSNKFRMFDEDPREILCRVSVKENPNSEWLFLYTCPGA